jgi:hypothetical protein
MLRKVVAIGPVRSVDLKAGTVAVLGQTYKAAPNSPQLNSWANELLSGRQPFVLVSGKVSSQGVRAKGISKLAGEYVAGATTVALRGKITSVNSLVGQLRVGKQLVDYSAVLSSRTLDLRVGSTVLVVGLQPTADGVVVAQSLK